jgi:hypothetical protein
MPIVHTSNARKCVAQGALGMILIDARSAHYGSGSSAQIVQRPSGHAASFVKIAFEFGKAAYWVLAIGRKDKIPLPILGTLSSSASTAGEGGIKNSVPVL